MIAALLMLAVFVSLLAHAALEAYRERRREWRLQDRIARIAEREAREYFQKLTSIDLKERKP